MPCLTVRTNEDTREIPFSPGSSVREILDAAGVRIRSGCRGNGACGLCLVQVEAGRVNGLTRNERLVLSPARLQRNSRLACQVIPEADLRVRILDAAPTSRWRELQARDVPCAPPQNPRAGRAPSDEAAFGLAVDLGTTHISLSLWDLARGERLAGRVGLNPQSRYGADVLTRLIAAGESPENAHQMARMPLEAVSEALPELASRCGVSPGAVSRLAIVGNTPMLALATGADFQRLMQPQAWTRPLDCKPVDPHAWAGVLGIHPRARVEVVSPLAGFVGSDLLAGVLATRLTERPGGLLLDFGTNSEMALWDGSSLWATSAAGGPAFESCDLQCGVPAGPGAIYRVDRGSDGTRLLYQVQGDGAATGLCGSGLIDLIALLRATGELTPVGKFTPPHGQDGFVVRPEAPTIRLTGGDVDMIQRAKAAVGVGIHTLLAAARMIPAKLNRVCVCGVFGRHLNVRNAQRIGLLPDIPPERVELCGNTALAGCEHLLLSPTGAAELAALRERATVINLAQAADFDGLFLENLYLQPLKVDRG